MLRTSKAIKKDLEKAENECNKHYENCSTCQAPVSCEEDEVNCYGYIYLINMTKELSLELEVYNETFEQELKDRNMT